MRLLLSLLLSYHTFSALYRKNIDKYFLICYINCTNTVNTVERKGSPLISINYRDARPIYLQVKDSLRRLIVTGAMPPGTKLPSVRELAASLAINPNTIQRAYRELEAEGYILSIAGKGSFAAELSRIDRTAVHSATDEFLRAAKALQALGMRTQELHLLLDDMQTKE